VLKFQDGSVKVKVPKKASISPQSRRKATQHITDDFDKMEPHHLHPNGRALDSDMLSEIDLFESLEQKYYEDDGTRVVEISNGDRYKGQ
jgi:hypothetical protein